MPTTISTPKVEVERMQRIIDAPAKDLLTAAECAAWLGIGLSSFTRLWHEGKFPPPLTFGERRALRWPWMDVLAFIHMKMRFGETETPPAATEGRRRRSGE